MATPEFSGARQVITLLPEAETSNLRCRSLHALMKIRPMACLLYHPSRLDP